MLIIPIGHRHIIPGGLVCSENTKLENNKETANQHVIYAIKSYNFGPEHIIYFSPVAWKFHKINIRY